MSLINLSLAVILTGLLTGCSIESGEQGIKSTDKEYMENLMRLMDKRNINYKYSDGYIRFDSSVKPEIEKIEELLSSTQSVQYKNEEVRKYFRKILDKEKIEYIPLSKEGGTWTMWWPENEKQENQILLNVVNYAFDNKLPND